MKKRFSRRELARLFMANDQLGGPGSTERAQVLGKALVDLVKRVRDRALRIKHRPKE